MYRNSYKVWVLTVVNKDVKMYSCTEATSETHLHKLDNPHLDEFKSSKMGFYVH